MNLIKKALARGAEVVLATLAAGLISRLFSRNNPARYTRRNLL